MNSTEKAKKPLRKPPPRYLGSKFQRKLLGLMFLLVLVLVLMRMSSNPENWNWFFMLSTPQQQNPDDKTSGNVEIEISKNQQIPLVASRPGKLPFDDVILSDRLVIPRRVFEGIVDWNRKNRIQNVTVNEAPAFYALLKKISKVSSEELQKEVQPPVSYSVLNEFAENYRGTIFRLRGTIRLCREIPSGRGLQRRYGLEHLYEAWLTTMDSGNRFYRVVFTELPRGLLTSEEPFDPSEPVDVQVTGYFFKIQGYSTSSEQKGAPLLLTRSPVLVPVIDSRRGDLGLVPYIVVFVVVIAGAVSLTVWRYRKSDREFETGYKKKMREVATEDIEQLQQIPTVTPEEVLKELSQDESPED